MPGTDDPRAWDRYAYSSNNPINYTDPSGHCSLSISPAGNAFSMIVSCIEDIQDAYEAYQAGETRPGVLGMHASGVTDALVSIAEEVDRLNKDLSIVFSNPNLKDRILPSVHVGLFAVLTSAQIIGFTQIAGSSLETGSAKSVGFDEYGPASSYTNKLLLQKQLASEAQLSESGIPIAGNGSPKILRDSARLANEYGGNQSDWAKMRSSSFTAWDKTQFETHWYQNIVSGVRVEYKTNITNFVTGTLGNWLR